MICIERKLTELSRAREYHNETAGSRFLCSHCGKLNEKGKILPRGFERYRVLCIFCRKERLGTWGCPRCGFRNKLPLASLGISPIELICQICLTKVTDQDIEIFYPLDDIQKSKKAPLRRETKFWNFLISLVCPYLYPYEIANYLQTKSSYYRLLPRVRKLYIQDQIKWRTKTLWLKEAFWWTNNGKEAGIKWFYSKQPPCSNLTELDDVFVFEWFIPLSVSLIHQVNSPGPIKVWDKRNEFLVEGRLAQVEVSWLSTRAGGRSSSEYKRVQEPSPHALPHYCKTLDCSHADFLAKQFSFKKEFAKEYRTSPAVTNMQIVLRFLRPYEFSPNDAEAEFQVSKPCGNKIVCCSHGNPASTLSIPSFGKLIHSVNKTEVILTSCRYTPRSK